MLYNIIITNVKYIYANKKPLHFETKLKPKMMPELTLRLWTTVSLKNVLNSLCEFLPWLDTGNQ